MEERQVSEFGVARLSVVHVRKDPAHRSELTTQLLFGEHYRVLESSADGEWLKINAAIDNYEGWIQLEQHHDINEGYFDQLSNSDFKICTDLFSTILFKKYTYTIPIGSILPITTTELFSVEENLAFNGNSKSMAQKRDAEFLIQTARKFLGCPYMWGGKSPFGIDCSGFTQIVFRLCGFRIPRDSSQQVWHGDLVDNFGGVKAGDLGMFSDEGGKIDHVGIVIDEKSIIHAAGKVRIDPLTEGGIQKPGDSSIAHQLHSIRRILP